MPDTSGSTAYGKATVNGLLKKEGKPTAPSETTKDDMTLVLQSFRLLIADLCQQFGMGHPGSAIGMAAIGVALWKYTMRYAPNQPDWFNRDRFLLSNGNFTITFTPQLLTMFRTCLSFPIYQLVSVRLQGHDLGATPFVPLRTPG